MSSASTQPRPASRQNASQSTPRCWYGRSSPTKPLAARDDRDAGEALEQRLQPIELGRRRLVEIVAQLREIGQRVDRHLVIVAARREQIGDALAVLDRTTPSARGPSHRRRAGRGRRRLATRAARRRPRRCWPPLPTSSTSSFAPSIAIRASSVDGLRRVRAPARRCAASAARPVCIANASRPVSSTRRPGTRFSSSRRRCISLRSASSSRIGSAPLEVDERGRRRSARAVDRRRPASGTRAGDRHPARRRRSSAAPRGRRSGAASARGSSTSIRWASAGIVLPISSGNADRGDVERLRQLLEPRAREIDRADRPQHVVGQCARRRPRRPRARSGSARSSRARHRAHPRSSRAAGPARRSW